MALAHPGTPSQPEGRLQLLTLHLDPLHNWSDLIVLAFAIAFVSYMALGEVLARGWSQNVGLYNDLSIFPPLAMGLSVMAWRRFRRVALTVDEEQVEAVSVWGIRKRCRLEDLSEVAEGGKPAAVQLLFTQRGSVAFKVWRNVWTRM